MDGSSRILEYINLRADFIGAVRLPTNIFNINGANTTTTTDVIILQKTVINSLIIRLKTGCSLNIFHLN